jgi:uncharacterized protein (DUF983 family)
VSADLNRTDRLEQLAMPDASARRDLPDAHGPRLRRLLARAVLKRCPQCGARGIFENWFSLSESCPRCAYRFERESGYFLGAYALNLIVAEMIPIALLIGLFIWADLSWIAMEAILIPLVIGLPLLLFPYARTMWMALDLMITRDNQR